MEYIPSYSDNLYADIQPSYKDSLMHHGIRGQKWGVRRFEDKSGHLTAAGKKRYNDSDDDYDLNFRKRQDFMNDAMRKVFGQNTKPNYMNIYNEMSKDRRYKDLLDSEDPDDYRRAEAAWLKKHNMYNNYKNLFDDNRKKTPNQVRSERMSEVYTDHPKWTAADILGKKYKHLAGPHNSNDTEYWNEWRKAMDERLTELGY